MSDQAQDQNDSPSQTPAADHTSAAGQEAIDMEPNILATSDASGVTTRHREAPLPPLLSESHVMPQPMPTVQILTQTEPQAMQQPMPMPVPALQMQVMMARLAVTEQQNLDLQRQLAHALQSMDHMRNDQFAQSPAGSETKSAYTSQMPLGGPLPMSPAASAYRAQSFPTNVNSAPDGNQLTFADRSAHYSTPMHTFSQPNIASADMNSVQMQMHPGMPMFTPLVMQPNGNSTRNVQVPTTSFSTRPNHHEQFDMLVQLYTNVPRWRIQQDAWLDLLPQLMEITGDNRERSDDVLKMILDESDALEILRLRCFPDALVARILGIQEREMRARFAQNSVMGISSIQRGGSNAARSDSSSPSPYSSSPSGPARSYASSGIYAPSASAVPSHP